MSYSLSPGSLLRIQLRTAVLLVQVGCWLLAAKHAERTSARVAYRMVELARAIAPDGFVRDTSSVPSDDEATTLA